MYLLYSAIQNSQTLENVLIAQHLEIFYTNYNSFTESFAIYKFRFGIPSKMQPMGYTCSLRFYRYSVDIQNYKIEPYDKQTQRYETIFLEIRIRFARSQEHRAHFHFKMLIAMPDTSLCEYMIQSGTTVLAQNMNKINKSVVS